MNRIARIGILTAAVLATACKRPSDLPDMGVSRTAVAFEAPAGSAEPAAQTVYVVNTGRGALAAPTAEIAYQDGSGWLTATVTGDAAPFPVVLQPRAAGLQPGVYRATVSLASPNASASPVQVDLSLTVPEPRFALSAESLAFVAPALSGDPAPQTFQVVNGGRGTLPVPELEVSYVGTTDWLSATVTGTPAAYTVTVTAHPRDGMCGTLTATLSIRSPSVPGAARTLAIQLAMRPELIMERYSLTIAAPADGSTALPLWDRMWNGGRGVLPRPVARVTAGAAWLSATVEPAGTYPVSYDLVVTADHHGALATGFHQGTIEVAAPELATTLVVAVSFYVPPPVIQVLGEVSWTAYDGCPVPSSWTVRVRNTGAGRLEGLTATIPTEAAGWLRADVRPLLGGFGVAFTPTAPPPVAVGSSIGTTVQLEATGAAPAPVSLSYTLSPRGAGVTQATTSALRIHAQAGAGDPAMAFFGVTTDGGCVPSPAVGVSYGDPPAWITTVVLPGVGRHDVGVAASVAGMAPGSVRSAVLHLTSTGYAQDLPVTLEYADLEPTGAMSVARLFHAVAALEDGRALVTGGTSASVRLSSVELYDPSTGRFGAYPPMVFGRAHHGAVTLEFGRILVCGGETDAAPQGDATCELSIAGGPWEIVASVWGMSRAPKLVSLPAVGKVLVASGGPFSYDEITQVQLLDTQRWTSTPAWDVTGAPVMGTNAVLIADGEGVLVAGGAGGATWRYDVQLDRWQPAGTMIGEHKKTALASLPDGRVLAVGGFTIRDGYTYFVETAEIWDPVTDRWTETSPAPFAHYWSDFVALPNGKIAAFSGLVPGGNIRSEVELFDPATRSWSQVGQLPARWHTAPVRLASGMILIVGGQPGFVDAETAEVFTW